MLINCFETPNNSKGECCFPPFLLVQRDVRRQGAFLDLAVNAARRRRWETQSGVKILGQGRTTASRWVKMCNLMVVPQSLPVYGGFQGSPQVIHSWAKIYLECKQSSQVCVGMYSLTDYYWSSVHVNGNILAFVLRFIVLTCFQDQKQMNRLVLPQQFQVWD